MAEVGPVKWVSESEVRSVLQWSVLVPAVSDTLVGAARGEAGGVVQPLRARLYDPHTDGTVLAMPGLVRSANALATKLLTMYPRNAALPGNLPTHSALVLLQEANTGVPLALMDGCSITELRTAAASAAATLAVRQAKETKDTPVVAVLGAGTQGAAHARVMNQILKPSQVRIWSRGGSANLVSTLMSEGIPAVRCGSVLEAVRGASVINTCTLAQTPILMRDWVKEGAHINSVGAASRTHQELEAALVLSSTVYADSMEAALAEAGDVILSGAQVAGEIGEVILGSLKPPAEGTTIFKSLGMAAEDAVAARLVYDKLYPAT